MEISGTAWPPEGRAAAYWAAEEWLEDQRFELMQDEDDELEQGPRCCYSGEFVRWCKAKDICDCFDYDELEEWRNYGVPTAEFEQAELPGISDQPLPPRALG